MAAVLEQPRQTKLVPHEGESQVDFVVRGNRELYRKVPDAIKRSRLILKYWRESGQDDDLGRIAAERFPDSEFDTIHDSPVFEEHTTIGSDKKRRVYDRSALQTIVDACNDRIRDTGDFAVLSGGHTPDDPTSNSHRTPEVLGYVGPFRLGMIGNQKPRWAIFADEHHHRSETAKLSRLQRRSAEVWLEDNILDPIAALGAEVPRLDTGMVRNCRLPNGRVVTKYSASFPGGSNTSPQSFDTRQKYAAGDSPMDTPDSEALMRNLSDADVQAIVAELLQSKPMQFVQSQMPPDWSPETAAADADASQMPDEQVPNDGASEGPDAAIATDTAAEGDDHAPEPAVAGDDSPETSGSGDQEPPTDIGAATADNYPEDEPEPAEDAATDNELNEMDEEDREHYAAHDSAGRKGFLQAWRKHRQHKSLYSAGGERCMPTTERTGKPDGYSRLQAENKQLREAQTQQQQRIDQLEARNRHQERYSKLSELRKQFSFNLREELDEIKDLPQPQFEKHCERIKKNYSRLPVGDSGFTEMLPMEKPEFMDTDEPQPGNPDKYSRRAKEIADASLKADPKKGLSWNQAMEKARQEIDGGSAAK